MNDADFEHFVGLDIRVGTIKWAETFEKARVPAYKMEIDFGGELGLLKSSAQITDRYNSKALEGTQVIAIVNFPEKQIADFMSQCLVLGIYSKDGVVLLRPDTKVENGQRIG